MRSYSLYTVEQEQWLRDNYHSYDSYDSLTEDFNKRFDTNRKRSSIIEKCNKRLGLNGMPNPSKYGLKKKEQLPIGTIRKTHDRPYIKVLDSSDVGISGYQEPYWLPLQKKIYQDAFGEIGPDKMVCFLDGNADNLELSNLYCTDRKISAIMARNHWWTDSKEHTLTAIKWCELFYAIKNI